MAESLGAQDLTGIDPESTGAPATPVGFSPRGIGAVAEIGGSGSRVVLDAAALDTIAQSSDPAIAAAGQVGSQVKVRVGGVWLIANIRALKLAPGRDDRIVAEVDFLGEGDEEKLTGKLYKFRRGVTRYPRPGAPVFPASTADLTQIYADRKSTRMNSSH